MDLNLYISIIIVDEDDDKNVKKIGLYKNSNTLQSVQMKFDYSEKNLSKLIDVSIYCISDAIQECLKQEETIAEIDIGIGILYIQCLDNNIKYKFIPSDMLDKAVKETLINKLNLLELKLETSLVSKITNIYKDLI